MLTVLPACLSPAQAEECLGKEEERVDGFLHASTKSKLLREVENEVLSKHQQELLQKEHSGCAVLLRDDKVGILPVPVSETAGVLLWPVAVMLPVMAEARLACQPGWCRSLRAVSST
jgi:hypothetical protein